MFSYQRNFTSPAVPCTREEFYAVSDSPAVADTIARCREAYGKGNLSVYNDVKKKLPMFCFMATFQPSQGKDGRRATAPWRLQGKAVLNGLVMHDFDKLSKQGSSPHELFVNIPSHWFDPAGRHQVLYAGITPSGDGLRLVTKAVTGLNLSDCQAAVATALGLKADASVCNADRTSFAVDSASILFINDEIFTYDNPDYENQFGNIYRQSGSHSTRAGVSKAGAARVGDSSSIAPPLPSPQGEGSGVGSVTLDRDSDGNYCYNGEKYPAIAERWLQQNGVPEVGARHLTLLKLAGDMRYICENSPANLEAALGDVPFVKDMISEGRATEIRDLYRDACQEKMYRNMPKRMSKALTPEASQAQAAAASAVADASVYQNFWERLKPLMAAPYDVATYQMDDENKLGGVFAAGTMFCTLMSRCRYQHYNGEMQRMNPQAYIIGDPAAGKGVIDKIDRQVMGVMLAADRIGREAEEAYKQAQKERASSSKAQKGEPLKRPEFCIRYLPSRTSNAIFYRRLKNAKEEVNGEVVPLHLYTFDSELDANNVAQGSGAWIGKHDLELKAFHNEWTGVDFANADSVNDTLPVFYNQVVTGTPLSLSHKVTMRNVLDGLCSRMAVFRMLSSSFKMIERGKPNVIHDNEFTLKQWGFKFDKLSGELPIKRLVEHTYTLCEQSAAEAEANKDLVLDYLRKRAVFYAVWFTVPRIMARAIKESDTLADHPNPVTLATVEDSDLEFATLMYDAVIYWQDHFFGQMLQDAWATANNEFKQRQRSTRNAESYAVLPERFSLEAAQKILALSKPAACMQMGRWVEAGYLKRENRGEYVKVAKTIDA